MTHALGRPSALARTPGDRFRSMSPGPGLNGRPSS